MIKKCIYTKRNNILTKSIFGISLHNRLPEFLLVLLAHCIFFMDIACAQAPPVTIKASLNRDHVLMGEPMELKVEIKTGSSLPVTKWVNLPDSFNHLEVLSRSPVDSVTAASGTIYRQSFTITGFDPGAWMIPALHITINKKVVYTDSLPVTIVPVALKDSAYHDIREIIDVPDAKTPWWYYLAGIVSLIALGALVWLWLKRNAGRSQTTPGYAHGLSPLEEALARLRHLETERHIAKEEWKNYYTTLTDIFKTYIERKFNIPALQKTTDEVLLFLNSRGGKLMVNGAAEALRISDAVKFARYCPPGEQSALSLHAIEKTIKELDHLKQ